MRRRVIRKFLAAAATLDPSGQRLLVLVLPQAGRAVGPAVLVAGHARRGRAGAIDDYQIVLQQQRQLRR